MACTEFICGTKQDRVDLREQAKLTAARNKKMKKAKKKTKQISRKQTSAPATQSQAKQQDIRSYFPYNTHAPPHTPKKHTRTHTEKWATPAQLPSDTETPTSMHSYTHTRSEHKHTPMHPISASPLVINFPQSIQKMHIPQHLPSPIPTLSTNPLRIHKHT